MTFKNILVPTDGSEYTKAAINNAVEMAKNYGAKITALYVI
ncbi:MAG: universal stress protein, partial [Methanomassiliicoccales archaeon]|nr:universal stress protein [Methanomassiliicoccales archaeon]MCI6025084.1 universal stress protein [Methanomassiliicoccales archaeon]